jgi:hypothetical protein
MELYSYNHLTNPHWEDRNKIIAGMMSPNKRVLDLGCGAKNLLKFYNPSEYLGVDGIPSADVIVDLNSNFNIPGNWDYAVNSGILEFVVRPDLYLEKIKNLSSEYFFSWWRGAGWGRMPFADVENLISKNYKIIKIKEMGLVNRIYQCRCL